MYKPILLNLKINLKSDIFMLVVLFSLDPILNSGIIIGSVFRWPSQSFNGFYNSYMIYVIYHILIIYDNIIVLYNNSIYNLLK